MFQKYDKTALSASLLVSTDTYQGFSMVYCSLAGYVFTLGYV